MRNPLILPFFVFIKKSMKPADYYNKDISEDNTDVYADRRVRLQGG